MRGEYGGKIHSRPTDDYGEWKFEVPTPNRKNNDEEDSVLLM